MPDARVPLDEALADARARRSEAEDLFDHPLATDLGEREIQRDKLMGPITALDEQIIALQAIRDEQAAAEVVVAGVTEAEAQQIRDALQALDTAIRRTETFQANLAILTGALGAINTITSAANRGAPAGDAVAGIASVAAVASSAARGTTAAPRYVCRMTHHEDLTEAVKKAGEDDIVVAGVRAVTARRAETKRIMVKCSEGHVNVFEIV